jgi:hypothetical protein
MVRQVGGNASILQPHSALKLVEKRPAFTEFGRGMSMEERGRMTNYRITNAK